MRRMKAPGTSIGCECGARVLSICVVNHNGVSVLVDTLTAVRELDPPPAEVLLIDNASTDGSRTVVADRFPEVRTVTLAVNAGPGSARNAGYQAAQGTLVGFLDNDVAPAPDCFMRLASALVAAPGAALAMPRVVHAANPERVQFQGGYAHCLGMVALEAAETAVADAPGATHEIGSLITACFLVDRSRWGDEPLQDESLFMYFEDHDLGLRARQLGHRILAVPEAVCRHGTGTRGISIRATGDFSTLRVVGTLGNRWRIILKRYQLRTIVLLAPALLLFELFQLAGAARKGWLRHWRRALGGVLRDLPAILRERRQWRRRRRVPDGALLSAGPLPFNPRLIDGHIERAAAAVLDAATRLNWRLVRPLLGDGRQRTRS